MTESPGLRTGRLLLMPLSLEQLRLCLDDPAAFERDLGVAMAWSVLSPRVRQAIEIKSVKMLQAARTDHPWYTYWLIVLSGAGVGIGLAGFKGTANRAGEVEIGYGIAPEYQNRGYMTEAARALIAWAFQDERCEAVTAWTERGNTASQRVLARAGMHLCAEDEEKRSWRIDRAR